jgi:hypothetical protein
MAYSEIGFIFSPALENTFGNKNNTGDIYGRINKIRTRRPNENNSLITTPDGGGVQAPPATPPEPITEDAILIFKDPKSRDVKNYIKENVYRYDDIEGDPYISLIQYFSSQQTKALRLKMADFAYLKDLGVYPINRLWILRRFPDNAIVPNNLLAWGKAVEPIATLVGWLKDDENSDLFSFNFNESWTQQNSMIDVLIGEILKAEYSFKSDMVMSVPGWSQGLLFGMLNAMGLTSDYNAQNVPTGDPNVLRTSMMREINSQSLQSSLSLNLETTYEQKYINGIDPGMAMLDLLSNAIKMGTSEMKFVLGNSPALQSFIGATYASADKGLGAWEAFAKKLVDSFISGINTFINDLTSSESENFNEVPKDQSGDEDSEQKEKTETIANIPNKSAISALGNAITNLSTALLSGTVYKYRWPLRGSIGLMSGINTTPWHLTIGNPYSPILNVGNILVDKVNVKLSNDLGFQDMPVRFTVNVDCGLSRPLGRSELERMFNNGYKRVYSTSTLNSLQGATSNDNSITSKDGVNATTTMSTNDTQPYIQKSKITRNPGGEPANQFRPF